MKYTHKELVCDLRNDVDWNTIRERAVSSKLDLKDVPIESRSEVREAINEYFKRKMPKEQLENPHIHYEVPHFCKTIK